MSLWEQGGKVPRGTLLGEFHVEQLRMRYECRRSKIKMKIKIMKEIKSKIRIKSRIKSRRRGTGHFTEFRS